MQMPIHQKDLIHKKIEFYDNNGAQRIGEVIRIKNGAIFTGKGKYRKRISGTIVSVKYGPHRKTKKKRSKINRATENILSEKVICCIHHRNVKEEIIWDDDKKKPEKKQEKKPEKKEKKTKEKKQEEPYKVQPVVKEHADVEPKEPKELKQSTLFLFGGS